MPDQPLLPIRTGRRLSADAVERLVGLQAVAAARTCPTIRAAELHPNLLRHTCTMSLLQAGIDSAVMALWLGHADIRSTGIHLPTDHRCHHQAGGTRCDDLAADQPRLLTPRDKLLTFLEGL
ncbi:tyrosine-type recombinase/integrase [Mycolicibacterium duvalii]|uniref:tyrosine-type recombinase/integrase n=1 Tax=Mycolicibacterium duvalii TaxID=39688 RepID=UPI001F2C5E04|nr:tyrosine-type recombinase/integrase [Mycolicibacterium duvalii]